MSNDTAIETLQRKIGDLNAQIEKANAELKIESSLERVWTAAMAMKEPADMLEICKIISHELASLNVKEIRNVQTAIFYEEKDFYMNYEYYAKHDKVFITEVEYRNHPIAEKFADQMLKGANQVWTHGFRNEEVKDWLKYQRTTNVFVDSYLETADSLNYYWYSLGPVALGISTYAPLSEEQIDLFKKFRNVFELAYRRYVDIEKAQAQAREAQIEAALEKVRSRSLAMHKSEELRDVVHTVFEKLKELNIDFYTAIIILFEEGSKDIVWWLESKAYNHYQKILVPYVDFSYMQDLARARENKKSFFTKTYSFDEKNQLFHHLFDHTDLKHVPQQQKDFLLGTDLATMSVSLSKNTGLHITSYSRRSFSEQDNEIFKRFANVFEQAYTRFLDLQKAEAQAREGQIEAALERVRSASMAMHHSEDLISVINVVKEQLIQLGFHFHAANFATDYSDKGYTTWLAVPNESFPTKIYVPALQQNFFHEVAEAVAAGLDFTTYTLSFEEKNLYFKNLFENSLISNTSDEGKKIVFESKGMAASVVLLNKIRLNLMNLDLVPYSDEENNILKRIAYVFEQSYIRFLDLQKAEVQAREAEIELALERVRARAMAMQKPTEFVEVVNVMGEQFINLDFDIEWANFGANGFDVSEGIDTWNFAVIPGGAPISSRLFIPYFDHPLFNDAIKQLDDYRRTGNDFFEMTYGKDVKDEWLDHLFIKTLFKDVPKEYQDIQYAKPGYTTSNLILKDTWLSIGKFDSRSFTDEQHNILRRFGKAFGQAYTRFLDLQKAEAQAREAQIEAGLERVRSRAMAMQNSEELNALIGTVFTELTKLDLVLIRCVIFIYEGNEKGVRWWMANSEAPSTPMNCFVKYFDLPVVNSYLKGWQERSLKWQYILEGQEKFMSDEFAFNETELAQLPDVVITGMRAPDRVYLSASFNNFGCFTLASLEPLSDGHTDILVRFAKVFDLTYTRFNDLKQAESQAREAKIEAALERVRARALAMQQPEELKDVAQVMRNEMGALGIEELETCSIYIHEKDSETAECWYALKDPKEIEKKMVTDHFHLELNETWVGREMKKFYSSDEKQTSIVMQGSNRKEWIAYCYKHSPVFSGFYGETIPDRTYHLYKFSHGYIGAAAPGDISAESWKLLSRAASVFSLAYSRFKDLTQARNDLVKLKEEKKRAEDALSDLKSTQTQLIQSEKMASLGELTAGIAHEIQNPLNFVNNFSDVSNELLEEMKGELETGNTQQAIEIVNDVKDNLEKILHHGKRADAIVKSMLQHSRSSSSKKEPTDINSLAEEYFRLAFHGLRAKDKSFNAKFETDLDKNIDKINIVPQEMGRVILNLINNAFYAVNEKQKRNVNGYEPLVVISTKTVKPPLGGLGAVEIKVRDNGDGIPQKVLDKIFQPFFTTKPTGQGTGLGLSLSYDIVTKGHGGELKVETKEGEGSEFIISLPTNN